MDSPFPPPVSRMPTAIKNKPQNVTVSSICPDWIRLDLSRILTRCRRRSSLLEIYFFL